MAADGLAETLGKMPFIRSQIAAKRANDQSYRLTKAHFVEWKILGSDLRVVRQLREPGRQKKTGVERWNHQRLRHLGAFPRPHIVDYEQH